ncbi:MAG: tetratricopeptide repeat protein, partial [Planctomycetes bacterium]|nr:tetratricopeptide repeat protein [Planctomycetota bacterium]
MAELEARLAAESDPNVRVDLLNDLSSILAPANAPRAIELAEEALALARELGRPPAEGAALLSLAQAHWTAGSLETALEHAKWARDHCEKLGDGAGAARALLIDASAYLQQGRLTEAHETTLEALRRSTANGDLQGMAIAHNLLGVVHWRQNAGDKALEHRLKSAEIHESIGDHYRLAMAYINIGNVYVHRAEYEPALDYYARSIEILERAEPIGHHLATAYQNVADVQRLRGNWDESRRHFEKALAMKERVGNRVGTIPARIAFSKLSFAIEDYDEAAELLEQARATAIELGARDYERKACDCLAEVHEVRGDLAAALKMQRRTNALQQETFDQRLAEASAEMRAKYDAERKEREAEIYQLKYVELQEEVERREIAERALVRAQKLESLGVMAGGVAHDFNNMLLCVLGYADMAREELAEEHPAWHWLRLAEAAGERAAELSQQRLAYAGR